MSMSIMENRYNKLKMIPVVSMAKMIFKKQYLEAYEKKEENFLKDENGQLSIKPLELDETKKIFGLVAPLCMPIYEDSEKTYSEVKTDFLEKWKSNFGGELFEEYLWIVSPDTKKSKSFEIQSYIKWKKSEKKERLAFIYLGYFWMYESEDETLEEATKRFFDEHKKMKVFVKDTMKKYGETKHIKTMLEKGALVFNSSSNQAIFKSNCFEDPTASVWTTLAIQGYFSWVDQINCVSDGDYDKYL